MTQITIDDDLARQIAGASFPIVLVDAHRRPLGELTQIEPEQPPSGLTSQEWTELKRRVENPGTYSTLVEIKQRLGWQDQQ